MAVAPGVLGLGRWVGQEAPHGEASEGKEANPETELAQRPRVIKTPLEPTEKEREEHEATHLPYQPWCHFCLMGKAPNRPHRGGQRDWQELEEAVPVVVMDYMFMTSKDVEKMSPILVIKDMKTKTIFAHVVSRKGTSDKWIIKRLIEDLDSLGYGWTKVAIRSDQEPAIVDVKNAVRRARWEEFEQVMEEVARHRKAKTEIVRKDLGPVTILEESPVAESSSNGGAENAIRHLQGQFRTLKAQLETKLGDTIPISHPLWTWLIEWAALSINRYHIGRDKLTAYQRVHHKECRKPIAAFGETVLYRVLDNAFNVEKHEARYREGVWLGLIPRTDEDLIGTDMGVVKASSVRRLCPSSRWNIQRASSVCGYPWRPVPSTAGDHIPVHIRPDATIQDRQDQDTLIDASPQTKNETQTSGEPDVQPIPRPSLPPRQMTITKALVEQYGYTPGCLGCTKTIVGDSVRAHSQECRQRITEEMKKTMQGRSKLEEDKRRMERKRASKEAQQPSQPTLPSSTLLRTASTTPSPTPQSRPPESARPTPGEGVDLDSSRTSSGAEAQGESQTKRVRFASADASMEPSNPVGPSNDMRHSSASSSTSTGQPTQGDPGRSTVTAAGRMGSSTTGMQVDTAAEEEDLYGKRPAPEAQENSNKKAKPAAEGSSIAESMELGYLGQQLDKHLKLLEGNMDVGELFSPPRVNQVANKFQLRPGWSLDLTTVDEDGRPWDFRSIEMRNRAVRKVLADRPLLVIGCPPCTDMGPLKSLAHSRLTPAEVAKRLAEAERHVRFCCYIYKLQADAGRFYLHEHPQRSSCWKLPSVRRLLDTPGTIKVLTHMCRFGMTSYDQEGQAAVLKPTYFMTNSPFIAHELGRVCQNGTGHRATHRHITLLAGKAKHCQVYPQPLCEAICRGIKQQKQACENKEYLLGVVEAKATSSMPIPPEETEEATWQEHWAEMQEQEYWDSASGQPLDPELVRKARHEEVQYIRQSKLYNIVPIEECYQYTRRAPIKGKWVDLNKGDNEHKQYRSRYCAKEFNKGANPELFAATPPLEALRALVSIVASNRHVKEGEDMVLMLADVSRAFFYAPVTRRVYVDLPPEEGVDTSKFCARLNFSLYGTRDAPLNWHRTYRDHLLGLGFRQSRVSPCVFWHRDRRLRVLIHGDDYVCGGPRSQVAWFQKELSRKFKIKAEVLGPAAEEEKEVRILNRVLRWTATGIEYEADPRHHEIIIRELGLVNAKSLSSPGSKDVPRQPDDCELLDGPSSTLYRAICARINFLALDRPDLLYSAKECSRSMSSPTRADWRKLKRIGRYLLHHPRAVVLYAWQVGLHEVAGHCGPGAPAVYWGYSDADWAGCAKTRRSTSGGNLLMGGHWIKAWSRTQGLVALSSGESELYAMVKTSAETIGLVQLLRDWGIDISGKILGDASACLGIIQRQGLGRLRHIDTHYLWVQEKAASKELQYSKVPGKLNMADLMTKYLAEGEIQRHMWAMGFNFSAGRAASAPRLVEESAASAARVKSGRPTSAAQLREESSHSRALTALWPKAGPKQRRALGASTCSQVRLQP